MRLPLNRKLFISKNESEVAQLAQYCHANHITLHSQSLIRFQAVTFKIDIDYDVIFFSSPRSLSFFLEQETIQSSAKIACIGKGTAKALLNLGFQVDFQDTSSDPEVIAQRFTEWCRDQHILFPISSISNKSISKEFPKENYTEVVVYETILAPAVLDNFDIYVFTSPSNYRAFRRSNTLPSDATLIAWGTSTAAAIRNEKNSPIVMEESSIDCLISTLKILLHHK